MYGLAIFIRNEHNIMNINAIWLLITMGLFLQPATQAQGNTDKRLQKLEATVKQLQKALEDHDGEKPGEGPRRKHWTDRFTLGGYGEIHANFNQGSERDQIDIHRLVLFLGYDFNDWIKLSSETEIEHAYVSSGSGGELAIEQLHIDLLLHSRLNVRLGRVLTPLGIINQRHEPPTFNGVERPAFARVIIPSTWSSDGLGIFGNLADWLKYEAYVVGGLDGSQFDSVNGIRGGRIKERPGLHKPAITGRLDAFPFLHSDLPYDQTLRLGLSAYTGGLDNGNKGSNPGVNADLAIYSGDFEYTISCVDVRGAIALERIHNAGKIGNGTASSLVGWYVETACHIWPAACKQGLLSDADLVAFVRYDSIDTQNSMPAGVVRNQAGDRVEWTMGLTFFLTSTFVIKTDYQHRDDRTTKNLDDRFNLGVGWIF